MRISTTSLTLWSAASLSLLLANSTALFAPSSDIQQPGTQPLQATLLGGVSSCDGCHGYYDQAVEPAENWQGSMMAHAGRDPLFWAALAIADSDYPGSGDYCIRCHSPRGWHEGRATQTDGSGLIDGVDHNGIECAICHNMVNPDGAEHPGQQFAPYVANSGGGSPEGFYGSGMQVLAGNQVRYGPYANTTAGHQTARSKFHRESEFCGTCHEVSNPVTGDLAANNGALTPLAPGTFSGVSGGPVAGKAAFNNPPYKYGIVERTFSELKSSSLSETLVSDYNTLPADVKRGAIKRAYDQALLAGQGGDHEDSTPRFFTCQGCHMEPVVGQGAGFGIAPLRYDLPSHDLTGGNTWAPNAIKWLDNQVPSRLRLGQGIGISMAAAMDRGVLRARASLRRGSALDITGNTVRVTNLTGHKILTGYPEGRRIWLRTLWMDDGNQVLREDGSYGSFQTNVNGTNYTVQSITDPNARVYQAKLGITQDWAFQLLLAGVSPTLPLAFDRVTGLPTMDLATLASSAPGTEVETFHFVLNNKMLSDNRIPPFQMNRDMAIERNAQPVPATQYGNPGPGGVYDHFDDVPLSPPVGATRAKVELLYQTASWEYIQFLLLANPGTSPFLATAGQDVFDAYMATGRSAPEVMSSAHWCSMPGTNEDLVMKTAINGGSLDTQCGKEVGAGDVITFEISSPGGSFGTSSIALFFLEVYDSSVPHVPGFLQGVWLNNSSAEVLFFGIPPGGFQFSLTVPPGTLPTPFGGPGDFLRWQSFALLSTGVNGWVACSDAIDMPLR